MEELPDLPLHELKFNLQLSRSNSRDSIATPRSGHRDPSSILSTNQHDSELLELLQHTKDNADDQLIDLQESFEQFPDVLDIIQQIIDMPVERIALDLPNIISQLRENMLGSQETKEMHHSALISVLFIASNLNRAAQYQSLSNQETAILLKTHDPKRRFAASQLCISPTGIISPTNRSNKAEPIPCDPRICRICECKISPGQMKEHSENCKSAQLAKLHFDKINKNLMLQYSELSQMEGEEFLMLEESVYQMMTITAPTSLIGSKRTSSVIKTIKQLPTPRPPQVERILELAYQRRQLMNTIRTATIAAYQTQISLPIPNFSNEDFKMLPSLALSVSGFTVLKPLARGAYGKVHLVQKKKTGDYYALKVISKTEVLARNAIHQLISEREAMSRAMSEHVVPLYFTFHGGDSLFLAMQYMPGGDLYALLQEVGALDEATARFYGSEVVRALAVLHSKGVVHCDLKPDNLMIGEDGHVRLTDFGLSRVGIVDRAMNNENSITFNASFTGIKLEEEEENTEAPGTPEYLAPEVLLHGRVGPEADWWSFGCVMYEFIEGIPPFFGNEPTEVFEAVIRGKYEWSDGVSPQLRDLVNGLLNTDPDARFGLEEVRAHPFFTGIEWDTQVHEDAPFQPVRDNDTDTCYFRNARHSMVSESKGQTHENHPPKPKRMSDADNDKFSSWTGINFFALHDLNLKLAPLNVAPNVSFSGDESKGGSKLGSSKLKRDFCSHQNVYDVLYENKEKDSSIEDMMREYALQIAGNELSEPEETDDLITQENQSGKSNDSEE